MIRVVIADDNEIVKASLKTIIEQDNEIRVVGFASDGEEAFQICEKLNPDLVLMDIRMPGTNGVEGTRMIKSVYDQVKVLVLTTFEDREYINDVLKNGAAGYILKDIKEKDLIMAIKSTAAGYGMIQDRVLNRLKEQLSDGAVNHDKKKKLNISFTPTEREMDIIRLIVKGKSNKEVAAILNIAEGTARNILSTILKKLDLDDRTQLAVFAIKNDLV